MRRGGQRRRWITPADAAVCCPSGRWGRRRTRVTECWAVFRAEDVYTSLLRGPEPVAAGGHGEVTWTPGERSFTAAFEIRANRVWRHGRVFLQCPQCSRRVTRLYVPTATAWAACRRCWGLTYQSRTQNNYKDSGGGLLTLPRGGPWGFRTIFTGHGVLSLPCCFLAGEVFPPFHQHIDVGRLVLSSASAPVP